MQLELLFLLLITKSMFIRIVSSYTSLTDLTDPRKYNAKEMPQSTNTTEEGTNNPIEVIVSMQIRDIMFSDEYTGDFLYITIKLKVRLSWLDSRLRYNSRDSDYYIFTTNDEAIWKPPLILLTENTASFMYTFTYFHIYPNSTITEDISTTVVLKELYSQRHSRTFSIRLMSMQHNMDNLTLQWRKVNPLEVLEEVDTSLNILGSGDDDFQVRACHVSTARLSRGNPGNHSCLEVYTEVRVNKPSSVFIVYIPGIIAVAISWVCFWIAAPAVLGNSAILTSCMLHLFIQKVSIVKDLSLLENIRTLDHWLDVCIGFVLAAYFSMVCVTYLYVTSDQRSATRSEERLSAAPTVQEEEGEGIVEGSDGEANTPGNHFHFLRISFNRFPSTADEINAICRVLFPLCFAIFMCVFFAAYYRTN